MQTPTRQSERMTLVPKNWETFQHYKDRSPSWIKLHRALLDDYEFSCLPVASRALAPILWLLASEYHAGEIHASLDEIAFRVRMTRGDLADAISPLIESGFFIASSMLAERKQDACLEKEKEKEKEKEGEAPAVVINPKLGDFCQAIVYAYAEANSPILPDTSRAHLWLAQGYEPEICLPVLRDILKRRPTVPLVYFDKPIAEAHGQKAPKRLPIGPDPPPDWDAIVNSYVRFKRWPKGMGNDPESPSCRAPPDVLRKYGIEPLTAN